MNIVSAGMSVMISRAIRPVTRKGMIFLHSSATGRSATRQATYRLMPTGGVNKENCGEWIAAGACAVGAGSDLTAGAKTGDYAKITEIAKEMVAAVAAARK